MSIRHNESHGDSDNKENREAKQEAASHFDENNRYKLKPNETYVTGEGNYEYSTDKLGRIKHCKGLLELHPENDRNNYAQRKAGGADRHTGEIEGQGKDDGGHLIGRRFGGSKEIDNIVAQDSHLNRGEYKKMEDDWQSRLEEKDENGDQKYHVQVDIRCKYNDRREGTGERDSERPSEIFVYSKVTDNEGKVVDKKIYYFKNDAEDNTHIRNMKKEGN